LGGIPTDLFPNGLTWAFSINDAGEIVGRTGDNLGSNGLRALVLLSLSQTAFDLTSAIWDNPENILAESAVQVFNDGSILSTVASLPFFIVSPHALLKPCPSSGACPMSALLPPPPFATPEPSVASLFLIGLIAISIIKKRLISH
jgi:hypothetical protein